MMLAKSDSDETSPIYYVQSPTRDSNDRSTQATPVFHSPMESPSHPFYGRHSRASSSSRVSGSLTSSSTTTGRKGRGKRNDKRWPECNVIEEEGEYIELPRRFYQFFIGVLGLLAIICLFCIIIWGSSRPYKPEVTVKSLTVHNFYLGQGSDFTGVPTKVLTTNCSLKIKVYNPATFFGIHVSSVPVNLMYLEIVVATGQLKKYYQSRKSHCNVDVNLGGVKIPLYGAGASLEVSDNDRVPMTLVFDVWSHGNVVGKLVKSRHTRHVFCAFAIDRDNSKPIKFKKDSCTYG
ncbi:hypothetical protein GH714_012029 [Hevea brasiliensis]|uniref:Late embryogenesis abundant protein LEA-2 subgroup domain-containing protein n=1 Tax=Hevea brasiliensis TaxID=3981 RepID=A0A6A6NA98_HEVBR|nr:hypothetical protein GH714_012029 [Hevea brasiliensis]